MSADKRRSPHRCLSLKPCVGIVVYLTLLAVCILFTQAFRSSISAITYLFVLMLPIADILVFIFSWIAVSGTASEKIFVITKNSKLNCSVILSNRGPFPISCAEVSLFLPNSIGTGCKTEIKKVTLPPFSNVKADITVRFAFRGVYAIGAKEICLYDWFRLVRLTKSLDVETTVKVLPRLLPSCGAFHIGEGSNTPETSFGSSYRTEPGDIRPYLPGDSFKSIHWKLSSKTEELQVRKHLPDSGHIVSIFCDFGGRYDKYRFSSCISACSDDTIAEEALSAARDAVISGHPGKLIWRSSDCTENISVSEFSDTESLSRLALALCEAKTEKASPGIAGISDKHFGSTMIFVTTFRSSETELSIRETVSLLDSDRVSVCLCDLSELSEPSDKAKYKSDLDALCRRMTESGIKTIIPERKTEEIRFENE